MIKRAIYVSVSVGLLINLNMIFLGCEGSENQLTFTNGLDQIQESYVENYSTSNSKYCVKALIEIPAGTIEKWELNKTNGKLELEQIEGKPRIIQYLGYPGNYGMIPRTLLPKDRGGDGDPLDVLVLGPPIQRGKLVKCKLIGVLYLKDRGEQDDKLIAVMENSPFQDIENIDDLKNQFNGVTEIIELWFSHYKGPNKIDSKGFGNVKAANKILDYSIENYHK